MALRETTIKINLGTAEVIATFADEALHSGTAPVSITVDQRRALAELARLISNPASGTMHPLAETLRTTIAEDEPPVLKTLADS